MFDDIILFVQLAESGSFSNLASKLKLTHQTISRRIRNLEDTVGKKLLDRNVNSIKLTPDGQVFYHKFQHHNEYLQQALKEFADKKFNKKYKLKVVLPIVISKSIIAPYLCDFLENNPNINLVISFTSDQVDVIQDGFDVAVTTIPPTSKTCSTELLYSFDLGLYASPAFFNTHKPINTLDDLVQCKFVGYIAIDGVATDNITAKNNITGELTEVDMGTPRMRINNILHIQQIAASGKMLVPGWDFFSADWVKNNLLVKVLPDYSFGNISCYLMVSAREMSTAQKIFVNFIKECFDRFKQENQPQLSI
jgi:DNA-binding transcriptional LysR family regulator